MAIAVTALPLQMALNTYLRSLVVADVLPPMNLLISNMMTAQDVPSGNHVQLAAKDVALGPVDYVTEPQIVIQGLMSRDEMPGTSMWTVYWSTLIELRLPSAGDSTPEDYNLIGTAFVDAVRDALTSADQFSFAPETTGGSSILPANIGYTGGHIVMILGPVRRTSPSKQVYWAWTAQHGCQTSFPQTRPGQPV